MATGRVTKVRAAASAPPTGRVTKVRASASASANGRVTRVRAKATSAATGRVTKVRATSTGAVPTSQSVQPFDTVSLGAGTWTQTGGITVTPPTYIAPAVHAGDTETFTSASNTQTVTVAAHTTFRLVGGQWRALHIPKP